MAGLLDTAQQRLMGLLNVPTEVQRFATNPQAFLSLLGVNKLPQATGFAAGATGLPPKDVLPGGVLNPPNLAYQQGYEQGEPISYAAMAAPMALPVGKAIAPKAYDMLENYMVQTGGLLPLEAYHGTPHTIQGKFDISKVGTGEGAQAYGHGMYFAQNPKVAGEYSKMLPAGGAQPSPKRAILGQEVEPLTPQYKAAQLVEEMGVSKAKKFVNDWAKNPTPDQVDFVKDVQNSLLGITKKSDVKNLGTGNLYKVDIPDEYIPNMLDWDKPLSAQPAIIKKLKGLGNEELSKLGINPDFTRKSTGKELTGESLYDVLTTYNSQKGASKVLSNLDIPGIRYLDQGSRPVVGGELVGIIKTPQGYVSKVKVENRAGAGFDTPTQQFTSSMPFKTEAEAKAWADQKISGGTSNFVVFDPTDVKILEKNNQKVKGLLGE